MESILYHGIGSSVELPIPFNTRQLFDVGPKISDIREALGALRESLISDQEVYGVIGPIDDMVSGASDTLLKTLEEMPPDRALILWAKDESRIPPTISSRVLSVYVPSKPVSVSDEILELMAAYQERDVSSLIEMTSSPEVISDFVYLLSKSWDLDLWVRLRAGLLDKNFDHDDFLQVMLEANYEV